MGGTLGQALPVCTVQALIPGADDGEDEEAWGKGLIDGEKLPPGCGYQMRVGLVISGGQDAFNKVVGREVVTEVRGELITGGTILGSQDGPVR